MTGLQFLLEHQRLETSGARAVLPFTLADGCYLAVPELAHDQPGAPRGMNGGTSDVDMPIYRWRDGHFVADGSLPVPGGEDAEFFRIGDDEFLATASIRRGHGPYDLNVESVIFRREGGSWAQFQSFPTFAAKQWHFFEFDARRFLALAQGVVLEGVEARHPATSRIYEWNGSQFVDFQALDGRWGYDFDFFSLNGRKFLCYADHESASRVLEWDGERFAPLQELAASGGRAFAFFEADQAGWLAFANIFGESLLYRWNGDGFVQTQVLSGPGGREFALFRTAGDLYLVQVNFIHGTPAEPKTDLLSTLSRWDRGKFRQVQAFPTLGGTDASWFSADGKMFLAVSNSLTADIRFRADSVIYRFSDDHR
jgi:hypothetical protein